MSFPLLYPILPLTIYSSLWSLGNVTLLTLHEWVLTLLPDVAPRIADDAVSERAFYKNALTGATTIVEYRRNEVCKMLCFICFCWLLIRMWAILSLSPLSTSHPLYFSLFLSFSLPISIPLSLSHSLYHAQTRSLTRKHRHTHSLTLLIYLWIDNIREWVRLHNRHRQGEHHEARYLQKNSTGGKTHNWSKIGFIFHRTGKRER